MSQEDKFNQKPLLGTIAQKWSNCL